jgi:hypothetical protein
MKNIIFIILLLLPTFGLAQEKEKKNFFKELYGDFLQYGTVYAAGNVGNAKLEKKDYFIRTNPDNLYDIPNVIDKTIYHPNDYRIGIGIRKLARFNYEIKPNFYNGTENNIGLSAPTSAVKGLEYLLHYEKQRQNGDEWNNKRFFVRHTGKYHIAKFETRESGSVGFEYMSGEVRARLPIGKKFSMSAGAIYRTHQQPYGYNPIQIWLNEKDEDGNAVNPWWTLGYEYGYQDIYYNSTDQNGVQTFAWYWIDEQGNTVAYTDEQFRDQIYGRLMNRFNEEAWSELESWAEIAPIVGFDFYHYKNNFWLHTYANWILPYHHYVKGDVGYSYLHRNGWDHEGHHNGHSQSNGDQWSDYQAGIMFGWKINKVLGIFIESEYTKFWDSEIYQSNFGINITFK